MITLRDVGAAFDGKAFDRVSLEIDDTDRVPCPFRVGGAGRAPIPRYNGTMPVRGGHRFLVSRCQRGSWFLGQWARLRFAVRRESPGLVPRVPGRSVILAPTQYSSLDPLLLALALPYRRWRALTPVWSLARTHTRGPRGWLMPVLRIVYHAWGGVELPPKEGEDVSLHEKLRGLIDALARGDVVMIFPEGRIWTARDPPIGEFARGVVHLQRVSAAPIVPVVVRFGERAWPRRRYGVQFGEPVRVPEQLDLHEGAEWLRQRALAILGEPAHGSRR